MYEAVHGSRFKYAHVDNEGNLHIRVEDFWNFELRWTSAKAVLGRYLQDADKLVPYYLVINLKIRQDVWKFSDNIKEK